MIKILIHIKYFDLINEICDSKVKLINTMHFAMINKVEYEKKDDSKIAITLAHSNGIHMIISMNNSRATSINFF